MITLVIVQKREPLKMGIVTTSSETAFTQPAEEVYAFVTNPANWPKTYPGSMHVEGLPDHFPLRVGDVWGEGGGDEPGGSAGLFTWHLAIAMPPRLWVFNSVGRLGANRDGTGGMDGRITVEYQFLSPGVDSAGRPITLFRRTMTIEAPKDAPMPDDFFRIVNPANIDRYHAAIARELAAAG